LASALQAFCVGKDNTLRQLLFVCGLAFAPGLALAQSPSPSVPTTTTWRATLGAQRLRLVHTERPNRASLYPRYHSRYVLHSSRAAHVLTSAQGRRWSAVMNRAVGRGAGTVARRSPGRIVVSGYGRVIINDLLTGKRSVSGGSP
jgi:hypothetical protein